MWKKKKEEAEIKEKGNEDMGLVVVEQSLHRVALYGVFSKALFLEGTTPVYQSSQGHLYSC